MATSRSEIDVVSLDIHPEHAADLMEAAMAVADEPLPPGRKLDALVAEVLGVEPIGWVSIKDGVERHVSARNKWVADKFEKAGATKHPKHKLYSRDATASNWARHRAYDLGLGWAVEVIADKQGRFYGYMQRTDGDLSELVLVGPAYRVKCALHARALAIVAAGSPRAPQGEVPAGRVGIRKAARAAGINLDL